MVQNVDDGLMLMTAVSACLQMSVNAWEAQRSCGGGGRPHLGRPGDLKVVCNTSGLHGSLCYVEADATMRTMSTL
eukprot:1143820-Pelagomonas_calceolata.AAC.6